jgi:Phage integrase, N-terminal SAM-like domain
LIADAGDQAARRFLEFFAATIRNKNTRMAYYRAAARFFAWCDQHAVGEIADIEPLHVAAYVEAMAKDFEKPTVKQRLAAIRMLFDWLVTGQVVATNPAHSVRGPKHVVKTGKTTVLTGEHGNAKGDVEEGRAPSAPKALSAAPRPRRSPGKAKPVRRRRPDAMFCAIPANLAASFALAGVAAWSKASSATARGGALLREGAAYPLKQRLLTRVSSRCLRG